MACLHREFSNLITGTTVAFNRVSVSTFDENALIPDAHVSLAAESAKASTSVTAAFSRIGALRDTALAGNATHLFR